MIAYLSLVVFYNKAVVLSSFLMLYADGGMDVLRRQPYNFPVSFIWE